MGEAGASLCYNLSNTNWSLVLTMKLCFGFTSSSPASSYQLSDEVQRLRQTDTKRGEPVPHQLLVQHAVSAVKGFFRSISLHPSSADLLQDALRLLGIWFSHGGQHAVRAVVERRQQGEGGRRGGESACECACVYVCGCVCAKGKRWMVGMTICSGDDPQLTITCVHLRPLHTSTPVLAHHFRFS